ncbi:MAG: hypothetical protein AAF610_13465, partial [Pseudomonadota bacterium]
VMARELMCVDDLVWFCYTHRSYLEVRANAFFGTETVRDAIRLKVTALFPEHEIEEFTELFWNRIQDWRAAEGGGA